MSLVNPYEMDLDPNPANYQPLTPLAHLERAALIFPDHVAIIHGKMRMTYREFHERSRKLASALAAEGIGKGDTVSVMLSNTPAMLEAHHGVPMTGAVLHSLNTRLDAAIIAFQLDHADSKILIVDREFSGIVSEALKLASVRPLVIDYDDPEFPDDAPFPKGELIGTRDYEEFLSSGAADFHRDGPADEWESISLNYTSGTTGNPKGVVYHHRGAALMGYANIIASGMGRHPVYLWTLPMFHCDGWGYVWSVTAAGATHVCLDRIDSDLIHQRIEAFGDRAGKMVGKTVGRAVDISDKAVGGTLGVVGLREHHGDTASRSAGGATPHHHHPRVPSALPAVC